MIFTVGEINTDDMMFKIDFLHKHTPYKTFYEVFGVKENADKKAITHAHRKAVKGKNPLSGKMSDQDYQKLVSMAFGVLRHSRHSYDHVLANGKMLFLGKKENFRSSKITLLLFTLFAVVMVDLSIFIKRYLAYTTLPSTKGKSVPKMFLYQTMRKVFFKN